MPTLNELAASYAQRIKLSESKREVARQIINEINSLTWDANKQALSKSEKLQLVQLIDDNLNPKGPGIKVEAADNSEIIDILDIIRGSMS